MEQKLAARRCQLGYQRHNGRWEARYRPTSPYELKRDEITVSAFKGYCPKKRVYKYEFLQYFDSSEEKDAWLLIMKADFASRKSLVSNDARKVKSAATGHRDPPKSAKRISHAPPPDSSGLDILAMLSCAAATLEQASADEEEAQSHCLSETGKLDSAEYAPYAITRDGSNEEFKKCTTDALDAEEAAKSSGTASTEAEDCSSNSSSSFLFENRGGRKRRKCTDVLLPAVHIDALQPKSLAPGGKARESSGASSSDPVLLR